MSQKLVNVHFDEESLSQVAIVTLNRPESLNALNKELLQSLDRVLSDLESNENVRAIVFTGAGAKAFVAGADIKEMIDMTPQEAQAMAVNGQRIFQKIEDLNKATLAAVNGFALGGGFELAMSCDFVLASDVAKFGLPEVSLGLIPGYGGTQRLARSIGKSLARMVSMTGDMFSASQLATWGLVCEVTKTEDLMNVALKKARTIASRGPIAVRLAKKAINNGFETTQEQGLQLEAKLFGEVFASKDHSEGLNAFIEKRKPLFTGK